MKLLAGLLLAAVSGHAAAEEHVTFRARVMELFIEGKVASGDDDLSYAHGQDYSPREDFHLRHGTWFEGRLEARLSERNRVTAGAFYGEGRQKVTLDQQIDFNDNVWIAGEELDVKISLGIFSLAWEHLWFRDENLEIWLGAGLAYHGTDVGFKVKRALAPHVDTDDGERARSIVPVLEAEARWRVAEGFHIDARVQGGALAIEGFLSEESDARFVRSTVQLQWSPAEWISLGIGGDAIWSRVRYHGREAGGGDFDNIRYELRMGGPSLSLVIRF